MKQLIAVALVCLNTICYAQFSFNYSVDTLEPEVKAALKFHTTYLDAFKQQDTLPNFSQYWSEEDCKAYKRPDQMMFAIAGDYPTYRMGNRRTILYIKPTDEYVHIKTLFARADSVSVLPFAITNHYIKNAGTKPVYINPITVNTSDWQKTTIRNVTWFYPAHHQFDRIRADSLIQSIIALEKEWKMQPIDIRYYFADTKDEIMQLRGFDYSVDMGNRDKPTGISDNIDNLVYCHGLGENYFHETVHIYLNHFFDHSPLLEGLAVMYGGSMGHDFIWHARRLDKYLDEHPEVDLNDWEKFHTLYIDNFTNTTGTVKAILCNMAYKKNGLAGIKRIMSYRTIGEVFIVEFKVKPGDTNRFLRDLIGSF